MQDLTGQKIKVIDQKIFLQEKIKKNQFKNEIDCLNNYCLKIYKKNIKLLEECQFDISDSDSFDDKQLEDFYQNFVELKFSNQNQNQYLDHSNYKKTVTLKVIQDINQIFPFYSLTFYQKKLFMKYNQYEKPVIFEQYSQDFFGIVFMASNQTNIKYQNQLVCMKLQNNAISRKHFMIDWKSFFCGNAHNRLLLGYFLSKFKRLKQQTKAIRYIISFLKDDEQQNVVVIRDLGSLNGTFIKCKKPIQLDRLFIYFSNYYRIFLQSIVKFSENKFNTKGTSFQEELTYGQHLKQIRDSQILIFNNNKQHLTSINFQQFRNLMEQQKNFVYINIKEIYNEQIQSLIFVFLYNKQNIIFQRGEFKFKIDFIYEDNPLQSLRLIDLYVLISNIDQEPIFRSIQQYCEQSRRFQSNQQNCIEMNYQQNSKCQIYIEGAILEASMEVYDKQIFYQIFKLKFAYKNINLRNFSINFFIFCIQKKQILSKYRNFSQSFFWFIFKTNNLNQILQLIVQY